jgi:hypothetical protein
MIKNYGGRNSIKENSFPISAGELKKIYFV